MLWLLTIILGTMKFEESEVDILLNDLNQAEVMTVVEEYGKNIIIHDVCEIDGTYYLVGGATRLNPSYGAMDAIIFTYRDQAVHLLSSFGGQNDDYFTSVVCGESLHLIGTSRSTDFISESRLFQSGFYMNITFDGKKQSLKRIPYSFDVFLESLMLVDNIPYMTGYVDSISGKDFLIGKVDADVEINILSFTGEDKFFDLGWDNQKVIAVGSTSSEELGAYAKRAVSLYFSLSLDLIDYLVDETSLTSGYYYYDNLDMGGYVGDSGYIRYYDGSSKILSEFNKLYSNTMGVYEEKPILDERLLYDTVGYPVYHSKSVSVLQKTEPLSSFMVFEHFIVDVALETINGERGEISESLPRIDSPGEYQLIKKLSVDDIVVLLDKKPYPVDKFTNVIEGEYYHDVPLLFFGSYLLDGEVVVSGTVLSEEGKYELRSEDETIYFRIKEKVTYKVHEIKVDEQLTQPTFTTNNSRWWILPIVVGINYIYRKMATI